MAYPGKRCRTIPTVATMLVDDLQVCLGDGTAKCRGACQWAVGKRGEQEPTKDEWTNAA